jgi:hypothetical protein
MNDPAHDVWRKPTIFLIFFVTFPGFVVLNGWLIIRLLPDWYVRGPIRGIGFVVPTALYETFLVYKGLLRMQAWRRRRNTKIHQAGP